MKGNTMQIIMTTAEVISLKNYIARLMNESARIAQIMGKEKEAEQDLPAHEVRIFGRELTESERTVLCGLIDFDKQHGTNQAEVFKESIKYAVTQEKALQAEEQADTNQHDSIPDEVLQMLYELGLPISDIRVIKEAQRVRDLLNS